MEKSIRTSFLLPADLQAMLRETSARLGRSQTELVREALKTYLSSLQPPPPACIGIGEDKALSGAESERWLLGEWDKESRG